MGDAIFILPELAAPRAGGLTLLVLADGNRRGSPEAGYARGARRVVELAEHLGRRPDVATLVACILSPENIARRSEALFRDLVREAARLGAAVAAGEALRGIRLELHGDLDLLRAQGGPAAALADTLVAAVAVAPPIERPVLRLVLGVGYGPDTPRELDVDVLLRAGMEGRGALRLSGLRVDRRVVLAGTTTLWPELDPAALDTILDRAKAHRSVAFSSGFGPALVMELARRLAAADPAVPLHGAIPVHAPRAISDAQTAALFAGPLRGCTALAVEHVGPEGAPPARFGAEGAPHRLEVRHGRPALVKAGEAILAPGQAAPFFALPGWLVPGYANVHACAPTAAGIVAGILAAQRFAADRPQLHGAERVLSPVEPPPKDEADRFVDGILSWADAAGLLLRDEGWRRAAYNYALTGHFIHAGGAAPWDGPGAAGVERAELAARYMILVAAGDEGIFDRALVGEPLAQRLARLSRAADFLAAAARGPWPAVPPDPGAELLAAIAAGLGDLLAHHAGASHPRARRSFVDGLARLYAACVAEHSPAPPGPPGDDRVLVRLDATAASVGAGLLFQASALAVPAGDVDEARLDLLDEAAVLLDRHFRLANDLAGFPGDRDPKSNTCAILVPDGLAGEAQARAEIEALVIGRRLLTRTGAEAARAVAALAEGWPWMGAVVRRGVAVGRRVYTAGHYITASRGRMEAIFAEVEEVLARGEDGL